MFDGVRSYHASSAPESEGSYVAMVLSRQRDVSPDIKGDRGCAGYKLVTTASRSSYRPAICCRGVKRLRVTLAVLLNGEPQTLRRSPSGVPAVVSQRFLIGVPAVVSQRYLNGVPAVVSQRFLNGVLADS